MVRTYKRKTYRAEINENDMKIAIFEVINKRMSERVASRSFNVKRDTLHARISKLKQKYSQTRLLQIYNNDSGHESSGEDDQNFYSSKYTVSQVFTNAQEKELVKYIKTCSDMNYGLTYKQIRTLAYDYSTVLPHCKIPNSWKVNKISGIDWLKGFMKRNQQEISLRKPESTSLARATAFNKRSVSEFFDNYTRVLQKHKFKPEHIYNIDETGVTTVLKPVKIVSTKGKKQVSQSASAERGELTTFVGIISAVGSTLPPVYVFPRIRNPNDYLHDAPTSSVALGNQSGWMTGDLFLNVLKHIKKHTNCSLENKILLLLDNHESHTTVRAINYCRDNGMIMLSFPPHTSHKLQPLDVGVYGPFKTYCSVAFNEWMICNPGKTITVKQIAQLTKIAFQNAFTPKNITKSFEKTGVWPLNSLAFREEEFIPSFVNNSKENLGRPQTTETVSTSVDDQTSDRKRLPLSPSKREEPRSLSSKNLGLEGHNAVSLRATSSDMVGPLPSTPSKRNTSVHSNAEGDTSTKIITPEVVRPLPRATVTKTNKINSRKGKSRVFTDTPEKIRLEEIECAKIKRKQVQDERNRKRIMKQVFPVDKKTNKSSKMTRKISTSSSESDQSFVLQSDDMSDDFSDMVEDEQLITDDDIIEQNDFVLVKFPLKTSVIYYVGKILEVSRQNKNDYVIKYLRRRSPGYQFYYPQVDDISLADRSDLVLKLPEPNSSKTTRTSSLMIFNTNFSSYNVK